LVDDRFSADSLPASARIACRVEYDGSAYSGWQSQPHLNVQTVQDQVDRALSAIADTAIRVHCAGRTDTGVHGFSQVIHFDPGVARSAKAWVIGGNSNLPRDIRLHWAVPVADDFHARFSALSRRYRYVIANTRIRPALLRDQVTWHRHPLAVASMNTAAQALLGEQDFSAFRAASCQSRTPMRCVQFVAVMQHNDFVVLDIAANAFLHHMVRNIAGALLAVGDGRKPVCWIAELLAGRDRSLAAETAPASGLYLVDVGYPSQFGLPLAPFGPMLLGTPPSQLGTV
jgi:tRNA pseudouridine38-40 synthase